MNVLFILADQHNASFTGCYGGLTRTPNLDALAQEGTVFEYAYTPCPMCAPARASLFSGRYVYENQCWDNCFPYDGEKLPGWGHYFRERNVHLATIGKLDFTAGTDNGVDSVFEPDNRTSYDVVSLFRKPPLLLRPKYHMVNNWDVSVRQNEEHFEQNIVTEARRWLEEERPKDHPWILNVNFSKPHSPWHPLSEKYKYYRDKVEVTEKYRQPEQQLNPVDREQSRHTCGFILDEEHLKDCHAAYHAIVEEHDENVGAVIQALKDCGIYEETLIIYSADHGELLRAHGAWEKSSMYEDSVRVPMIVKLPGGLRGHRVKSPVSLLDVFPTINEFLGFEEQKQFRGSSLIPFADGKDWIRPEPVFMESHANGRITGTFAIRKKQWKLIHYEKYGNLLFDLSQDPDEMRNLAEGQSAEGYGPILEELLEELYRGRDTGHITEKAFQAQEDLKDSLFQSGRLERELNKRGYSFDGKELYYLP